MGDFEVKDSGKMAEYVSGMRRDTTEGKPKFSLMWPEGIPYEEQLMYRVAMLYMAGGKKYGDRNWEKSHTAEDLAHHTDATERHLHKFLRGVEDGEDHAAAVVWGINAVLLTRWNIFQQAKEVNKEQVNTILGVEGLMGREYAEEIVRAHELAKADAAAADDSDIPDDDADDVMPLEAREISPIEHRLYPCGHSNLNHGWGRVSECLRKQADEQEAKEKFIEAVEKSVKRVHSHPLHQPCLPGCPIWDHDNAKLRGGFEFTGEQVEIERPDSRPGGGMYG